MRARIGLFVLVYATACSSSNPNGQMDGGNQCTVIDGQCLPTPIDSTTGQPAIAKRTQCGNVTEYCDSTGMTAPNLSCITTPKVPPAGPATVTLTGFVHVFSHGPDSKGVSIAVYDAAQLMNSNPSTVTPLATIGSVTLDPTTQRACDQDPSKGCSIPSMGCTLPVCPDGLNGHPDNMMYCRDDGGGQSTCAARLRWEARYSIANVPTNKQLVIKTSGVNFAADQTWATTFTWNVFLSTGDAPCTSPSQTDCIDTTAGTYQLNVSALSQSDYVNIPTVAGLSGGLPMGQGAIAGEIHDCDNVRVGGLSVSTAPEGSRFTYFNGNPLMTLPDLTRLATDQLGLYAALSVTPGHATVVAGGLTQAGGTLTSFGTFDCNVFADSVAIVNVNGGKPHQ